MLEWFCTETHILSVRPISAERRGVLSPADRDRSVQCGEVVVDAGGGFSRLELIRAFLRRGGQAPGGLCQRKAPRNQSQDFPITCTQYLRSFGGSGVLWIALATHVLVHSVHEVLPCQ